ncbi:MAG TPA: hypothetical protein VLA31_09980, partial [Burkholderiaceae bacterium]|nr:hypothetical protein [Burkholderiaceae bacterium]
VGGWANLEAVRLSVAATWDEDHDYRTWWESQVTDLLNELLAADIIVGFNTNRFDYRVLSFYSDAALFLAEKTFDILAEIRQQGLGLVGLDKLSNINLGQKKLFKSDDAVSLFRRGKFEQLETYVRHDVELTKDLLEFWQKNGFIWVDRARQHFAVWPGLRPTQPTGALWLQP